MAKRTVCPRDPDVIPPRREDATDVEGSVESKCRSASEDLPYVQTLPRSRSEPHRLRSSLPPGASILSKSDP